MACLPCPSCGWRPTAGRRTICVRYLRDAYLLWTCPQLAEKGFLPRERSQSKLYAIDPLVARLALLRSSARSDVYTSVLAEMQIGMALRRAALTRVTREGDSAVEERPLPQR